MKLFCRHSFWPLFGMLVCLLGMTLPLQAFPGMGKTETVCMELYQPVAAPTVENRSETLASFDQGFGLNAPKQVQVRLDKKRKIKFLIRHLQHQPAARRVVVKENFELAPAADPHHETVPGETWPARPRYYIFLFRLSPF